jgi:hypothetical protein
VIASLLRAGEQLAQQIAGRFHSGFPADAVSDLRRTPRMGLIGEQSV